MEKVGALSILGHYFKRNKEHEAIQKAAKLQLAHKHPFSIISFKNGHLVVSSRQYESFIKGLSPRKRGQRL